MKHVLLLPVLAILAAPSASAETKSDIDQGLSLLERGARLLMQGLSDEVEPTLKEFADAIEPTMREFADQMEPALQELLGLVDNLDAYELPERLPNGDIIIRRKDPLPDLPNGQIEL